MNLLPNCDQRKTISDAIAKAGDCRDQRVQGIQATSSCVLSFPMREMMALQLEGEVQDR